MLLQSLKAMNQLLLLITVLLYLLCQGHLPLLMTVHMLVQCREVLVNPLEDIGYLLLGVVESLLQSIMLANLLEKLIVE